MIITIKTRLNNLSYSVNIQVNPQVNTLVNSSEYSSKLRCKRSSIFDGEPENWIML